MKRIALITGVSGQDGSYLAELLLRQNYKIFGLIRDKNIKNIEPIINEIELIQVDIRDYETIDKIIERIKPNEVYNYASQSNSLLSMDLLHETIQVNAIAPIHILDALKRLSPKSRLFQASSSEVFGTNHKVSPQDETSSINPQTPYAAAKAYVQNMIKIYREQYNMFAVSGIFYNHESERRSIEFVTKKIVNAVVEIYLGSREKIEIGNLDSIRDWGYAPDYVFASWLMLQSKIPKDYIIATGETHTVRELIETAFRVLNIDIQWRKKGFDEYAVNIQSNKIVVTVNKKYYRHQEIPGSVGCNKNISMDLGWHPSVSFKDMIEKMVKSELVKNKGEINV